MDNFTDSIMVLAATMDAEGHPLYQSMIMKNDIVGEYSYYWHGYVAVLRPLLALLDYSEIRVLNNMLQILLAIALFSLLKKRKGTEWGVLSLSVYGLLFPMALAFSLQYSWVYYITMVISLVMLRFEDRVKENYNVCILMMVSGMLTSYFDLLTYPLVTWAIPIIWWLGLNEDKEEKRRLNDVILSGFSWILGYGGMWAGKWLLGGLITGKDIWGAALNEVSYRAGLQEGTDGSAASHLDVFFRNFEQCDNIQYLVILVGWLLWFVYKVFRNEVSIKGKRIYSYVLVALSSFVWYTVLHNHTFVHATFTYRIYTIYFIALFAAFLSLVSTEKEKRYSFLWLILTLGAIFLAVGERDELWNHNGAVKGNRVFLESGQVVEQDFIPLHKDMTKLHLGLYADGSRQGVMYIELTDDEEVLESWELPVCELVEGSFTEFAYDGTLDTSKTYTVKMCADIAEGTNIWIFVTDDAYYPMAEFASVMIDEAEYDFQMLGGITYKILPRTEKLSINFVFAFGVLMMVTVSLWTVVKDVKERAKKAGENI